MTWFSGLPGPGLIMSAKTVAGRLPVAPDAAVLEVGPGSGDYTAAVARRIPQGMLRLLDIQPKMLAKSAARLAVAGVGE